MCMPLHVATKTMGKAVFKYRQSRVRTNWGKCARLPTPLKC